VLVLGINAHHADAAAVLYQDGRLVAAIAEERLNRIKHCAGFPTLAVREVLRLGGATLRDVNAIGLARDTSANMRSRLAYIFRNLRKTTKVVRKKLTERVPLGDIESQLVEACGASESDLKAKVRRIEHHVAHAASTFLPSPFERAAILTLDGFGDFASTLWGEGTGSSIKVHGRVTYPHSLGILYSAVCQFIGFDRYGDEGKVMGLAPFGEPRFAALFERMLRLTPDGFVLDLSFFNHHTEGVVTGADEYGSPHFANMFTADMASELGPARKRTDPLTDRERDIAASLQNRLDQAFVHLAKMVHAKTGLTDLCLAGGVALNGVANARILEQTPIKRLYIQPAAGDDGTAIGAAAWLCAHAGLPRFEMKHASWGTRFDETEIRRDIESTLSGHGDAFEVTTLPEAELLSRSAELVAQGKILGWFQGAMEWGPRALGNRSIIAHPGLPGMKDTLNARIKHREPFRPFAPAILQQRLPDYFESSHPSPFMLLVYRTRPDRYGELCAVDHVDHTGRVQTVTRDQNPRYYGLIEAFDKITGTPVVLNTSFNENEPIVCTPRQALDCFVRTNMDAVVLGDQLCVRRTAGQTASAQAAAAGGAA